MAAALGKDLKGRWPGVAKEVAGRRKEEGCLVMGAEMLPGWMNCEHGVCAPVHNQSIQYKSIEWV